MENELIKKFAKQLANDKSNEKKNPLKENLLKYKNGEFDDYDYIDKIYKYNKILYDFSDFIPNTDISQIEISDSNVIFTTRRDNLKILFNGKYRRGIPFEILYWGKYENFSSPIYSEIIQDRSVILDIGANIGWFSLVMGKRFPRARIFGFEVINDTFGYYLSNITLNNLKNIKALNLGISDFNGTDTFYFSEESSSLASSKNIIQYSGSHIVNCDVKTLDAIVEELELDSLDLMKCDVEGGELKVLKGGAETIDKHNPVILMEVFHKWLECFQNDPNEIFTFLYKKGYRSFYFQDENLLEAFKYEGEFFNNQNFMFFHKEKHSEIIKKVV
ncbi:MAG: hypothetical protein Tsb0015_14870 [Simkaniaceae bacterium]